MKKKTKEKGNYLDKIPCRKNGISWDEKDGIVTLNIENKGLFNKIAQKLFKKPKISYIHLDEFGSFVWTVSDGVEDITAIGERVKEKFGEKAEPLYPRLAKYFQILDSYGFVEWENTENSK